jgi:hypothetical protein
LTGEIETGMSTKLFPAVLSRACEGEKGAEIARSSRLQCIDIAPPKVTGSHQIRATPGKGGLVLPLGKDVRYETGVALRNCLEWLKDERT